MLDLEFLQIVARLGWRNYGLGVESDSEVLVPQGFGLWEINEALMFTRSHHLAITHHFKHPLDLWQLLVSKTNNKAFANIVLK